ncbi:MAG: glycoside hydrolase family 28 protein [Ignavibacteriae bacterium]|nr:MAG: glycoside hydrolase family 28 protein [Ignavibacteriota bacterium]
MTEKILMKQMNRGIILLIMSCFLFSGILGQGKNTEQKKDIGYISPSQSTSPQVAVPTFPQLDLDLADFGAIGDGLTLNTESFSKALEDLSGRGGGRLVIPPGIWLTGPIQMRSNVCLHLEAGALIQFSRDYTLYPLTVISMKGEKEVDSKSPISGENLENVAITGEGIIDGGGDAWRMIRKSKLTESEWKSLIKSGGMLNKQGDAWWPSESAMEGEKKVAELQRRGSLKPEEYEPYHLFLRPKMLRLINCKKVFIEGVTFQNPPNWTINPVLCEDVTLLNVQVRNSPSAQNSDAVDIESCRRAVIRGCMFDVGDDGICLKSGKDAPGRRIGVPTEDVLIENCIVYHAHGGFTIGSEMSGNVRNVRVNNCTFIGTDIGLRFKSTRGRGGVVEKIFISNIRMMDIPGDAINFNLYYGGKAPLDITGVAADISFPPVTEETPLFHDIHIENVICRGAQSAIVLQGLPEMPLRDLTLKNVSINSQFGVTVTDAENILFENVRVENKTGDPLRTFRVKNSRMELMK